MVAQDIGVPARGLMPELQRDLEALVRIPPYFAVMIPYTLILTVAWLLFFIAWYLIGIPVGPGWPIR